MLNEISNNYDSNNVKEFVNYIDDISLKSKRYDMPFLVTSILYFDVKGYIKKWKDSIRNQSNIKSINLQLSVYSWVKSNCTKDELSMLINEVSRQCEVVDNLTINYILDFCERVKNQSKKELYSQILEETLNLKDFSSNLNTDFIPVELIRLISYYVDKSKTVYNPFSGTASCFTSFISELEKTNRWFGEEFNLRIYVLGKINLFMNDINADLRLANSVEIIKKGNFICDNIISIPPFSFSPSNEHDNISLLLTKGIELLSDEGKMVLVCPTKILTSKKKRDVEIRKMLIDNDYLEKITLLPEKLFYPTSTIPTCIIYINKNKKDINDEFSDKYTKGLVEILDATTFYLKKNKKIKLDENLFGDRFLGMVNLYDTKYVSLIPNSEIVSKNYSLNPGLYFNLDMSDYDIPEGFKSEKLDTYLKPFLGIKSKTDYGRLVTPKDLTTSLEAGIINSDDIAYSNLDSKKYYSEYRSSVLITTSMFENLKFVFINIGDSSSVFVPQGYLTYSINEALLNPGYLFYCFSQEYFAKQLKLYWTGSVIKKLDINDFLNIKVLIPDNISVQEAISSASFNANSSKDELISLIKDQLDEYKTGLRVRKHNLAQLFPGIFITLESLRIELQKTEHKNLIQKVDNLITDIKGVSNSIDMMLDEKTFGEPEHVDLEQFIDDYIKTHELSNGKMELWNSGGTIDNFVLLKEIWERNDEYHSFLEESDDEPDYLCLTEFGFPYEILANKNDLTQCFNNIVQNVISHGFNQDREDYRIVFYLTRSKDDRMNVIKIMNNGTPPPKGFTEELYFTRGGNIGLSGNQGLGGSYVKEMTEHFGGFAVLEFDGGKINDWGDKKFDWQSIDEEAPIFNYTFSVNLFFINVI